LLYGKPVIYPNQLKHKERHCPALQDIGHYSVLLDAFDVYY
jgi:hypothetical protein